MYTLAVWIKLLGAQPFTLRVATATLGILTLAAVFRLAHELSDRQTAAWAMGALGVLYWHVHLSHIALRAISVPLIGALALALLLNAHRTNRLRMWLGGGFCLGLTIYTYFSSVVWLGFGLASMGWWFIRESASRRGIALGLAASTVVAIPMAFQLITGFDTVAFRPVSVAVLTPNGLLHNADVWLNAWVGAGSHSVPLNFPDRPIFDAPLAALATLGLIALGSALFGARRAVSQRAAVWTVGLAALTLFPSLISDFPPHPLRAIGLVVPIGLVAGMGAGAVIDVVKRYFKPAFIVPLVLIAWGGLNTAQAFQQWVELPIVYLALEEHINTAAAWIDNHVAENTAVYFSPFSPDHPDIGFNEARLAPRRVSAFDARQCEVLYEAGAVTASLDIFDPDFQTRLLPYADVKVLYAEPADPVHFRVYEVTPRPDLSKVKSGVVNFGDVIAINAVGKLPDRAKAGDTVKVWLMFRALQPLNHVYSTFIHVYGQPTPYEGGKLWGQADSWICPSHLAIYWKPGEMMIQSFDVAIDPSTPAGTYTLAVGVYDSDSTERLPTPNGEGAPERYTGIQLITISR